MWSLLVDLADYPQWNPYTLRVVPGYLVPGHLVELLVRVDDQGPRREVATLRRWAPGEELRWVVHRGPAWWFQRERVQRVEPLGEGRCCYLSEEIYHGLWAGRVDGREGARRERAVERMAAALKRRAEEIPAPRPRWRPVRRSRRPPPSPPLPVIPLGSEPSPEREPFYPIDPEIREVFLLRGYFVPSPPSPEPPPPSEWTDLLDGYARGITTYQWPTVRRRGGVSKADWHPCHACATPIPVELHRDMESSNPRTIAAISYVCPRCNATQVGGEVFCDPYEACHECKAPLDALVCARCGLPRGWALVGCPTCGAKQAVVAPHLGSGCDVFNLECVACETPFCSLCIC